EDYKLDVVLGKGPSARSIRLDLPRFTMVAATTRPGRITLPLRERFGMSPRLDYYSETDLGTIVRRSAGILGVELDDGGAAEPYLLQLGFLKRTPRGRVATARAFRHLGVELEGALPLGDIS